ncbi:MAG: hypothetical protein IAE67_07350 [Candidatus Competibacteraceae bacterium]|nr:hypothetical protein [Candidatus Competibacteraceae bacterium]
MWISKQLPNLSTSLLLLCFNIVLLSSSADAQPTQFPQKWYGKWQGTMHMFPPVSGYPSSFTMQLHLAPGDSSYITQYTIHYGEGDHADIRAYLLKNINGAWAIDEQNGIVLSCNWYANSLFCWFDIQEQHIICKISFEENDILYEIFGGHVLPTSSSGGMPQIPIVHSYTTGFYQYARLTHLQ